ncbi:MAG: oxidative damage protection protein [Pseudomonadales bacterium]|nr:oxidative damage protection protein [Pseudomonadales bacterium]MDP6317580.1 oxidative damage protection protein [Pseudomonadales bacterium]MDP7316328.1 oxidative damage protection protein [Pseudomonadales bacterium]MDP7576662.1 oxidative damage protection protein [Pseudomonadales bacterium]HJP50534.1 oxidative damage protection protein [Pseudomonadales bacterium]|tara:strand:+ start:264 stop:548 length:285 start_codon:yes stop_codon:yes gene_type:complete
MTRMVTCSRLKQELPGLDAPPFPGSKGLDVFENVSAQAWQEWQILQTMLINEKHLNMMDKEARKYLNEQRDRFLAGEEVNHAEGFIPTTPENDG